MCPPTHSCTHLPMHSLAFLPLPPTLQAVEVFLGLGLQRHFKGLDVLYPPGATNDFGALEPADLLPVEEGALHRVGGWICGWVEGVWEPLADARPCGGAGAVAMQAQGPLKGPVYYGCCSMIP